MLPSASFAASYDPASDVNSMANTTAYTGAPAWWAAGYTGQGVDVALIDTGVSPVDGLRWRGKVINGPDLSLESQAPEPDPPRHQRARHVHGRPHRRQRRVRAVRRSARPTGAWRPDARIVSVKVGVADGGTDVCQVIAAIDWVVQHRNDDGLNIRVLNLSYGTNSTQDYTVDPLAFAAEQAWKEGIVVVAAAGNYGFQNQEQRARRSRDPAYRPLRHRGRRLGLERHAHAARRQGPGLLAVAEAAARRGASTSSPRARTSRACGSRARYLDQNHPEGQLRSRYFRGSGTSRGRRDGLGRGGADPPAAPAMRHRTRSSGCS